MKAIEQDMVDTGELVKMVPLEQSLDSELVCTWHVTVR